MESILNDAIKSVQDAELAYCKFLAANDTKSTKANQSGYLLSKSSWRMFFEERPAKGKNLKCNIKIRWQNDFETGGVFTYYGAEKNEFRLTGFGRGFPYREEDNVGDLFVLSKVSDNRFEAFILSSDEDIDAFLDAFNISSNNTNALIPGQFERTPESKPDEILNALFLDFLNGLTSYFPTTIELAENARTYYDISHKRTEKDIISDPDEEILHWIDAEFQLFKIIENDRYSRYIQAPFKSVEELIKISNIILNRRKSRAGKSLEHHLSAVFNAFGLKFASQEVTKDNKKPDFLFPGMTEYLDPCYDKSRLVVLAAKTTCKDRWRQIINETEGVTTKHLFTLQQGISKNQLKEMYDSNVCLVVPKAYLSSFPDEYRDRILTLESFIKYVQRKQE